MHLKGYLWRHLLLAKYGGSRNRWDIKSISYKSSAIWEGITSVHEEFKRHIKYRVGSGEDVLFWLDNWVGDHPQAAQFPDLVNYAFNTKATVSSYLERHESRCHLI